MAHFPFSLFRFPNPPPCARIRSKTDEREHTRAEIRGKSGTVLISKDALEADSEGESCHKRSRQENKATKQALVFFGLAVLFGLSDCFPVSALILPIGRPAVTESINPRIIREDVAVPNQPPHVQEQSPIFQTFVRQSVEGFFVSIQKTNFFNSFFLRENRSGQQHRAVFFGMQRFFRFANFGVHAVLQNGGLSRSATIHPISHFSDRWLKVFFRVFYSYCEWRDFDSRSLFTNNNIHALLGNFECISGKRCLIPQDKDSYPPAQDADNSCRQTKSSERIERIGLCLLFFCLSLWLIYYVAFKSLRYGRNVRFALALILGFFCFLSCVEFAGSATAFGCSGWRSIWRSALCAYTERYCTDTDNNEKKSLSIEIIQ